jgi:hypothetical protein
VNGKELIVSQLSALALAIVVSLTLSTFIVFVMTKPLRAVLQQLCPRGDAITFWMSFTTVMFYIAPLLFTLLFESTIIVPDLVNVVRTGLASSLFGSFAALLVVGYQISQARALPR